MKKIGRIRSYLMEMKYTIYIKMLGLIEVQQTGMGARTGCKTTYVWI